MSSRVIFPLASVRGAVAVHEPGSVGVGIHSVMGGRSLDRIPCSDVLGPTVEGGMLAKCVSSPRLETRTKESNICASTGVSNSRAQ